MSNMCMFIESAHRRDSSFGSVVQQMNCTNQAKSISSESDCHVCSLSLMVITWNLIANSDGRAFGISDVAAVRLLCTMDESQPFV